MVMMVKVAMVLARNVTMTYHDKVLSQRTPLRLDGFAKLQLGLQIDIYPNP